MLYELAASTLRLISSWFHGLTRSEDVSLSSLHSDRDVFGPLEGVLIYPAALGCNAPSRSKAVLA